MYKKFVRLSHRHIELDGISVLKRTSDSEIHLKHLLWYLLPQRLHDPDEMNKIPLVLEPFGWNHMSDKVSYFTVTTSKYNAAHINYRSNAIDPLCAEILCKSKCNCITHEYLISIHYKILIDPKWMQEPVSLTCLIALFLLNWQRQGQREADMIFTLQWRHNAGDGVSNHWCLDCLLNRLFRSR